MNSKAVALFLSLGLMASLVACTPAPEGGGEGGTPSEQTTPPSEQGGEEGKTPSEQTTPSSDEDGEED